MINMDSKTGSLPAAYSGRFNYVVLLCFFVIVCEGYDAAVMGSIVPALMRYTPWNLNAAEIGAMSSVALLGTLVGCYVVSVISDLMGRRPLLLACVTMFSISMALAAIAPTPFLFTLARGIGGIGLGGVISASAALTVEFSSPDRKNFNFTLMYSGYFVGALLSALVALLFMQEYTWRVVVAVGALPLLYVPVLWKYMPESPLYLVSRDRSAEARSVAASHGLVLENLLAHSDSASAGEKLSIARVFSEIFSSKNFLATVAFWVAQIAAVLNLYGIGTWLPQIMRQMGFNLGSSLAFLATFMTGSAIGGIMIGRYADRLGPRKLVLLTYLIGAVCLISLSFRFSIFYTYCLIAVAGLGTGGVAMVQLGLISNYYAAHVRSSAIGWAVGIGRVGAMAGPLVGGFILREGIDVRWNFYIFAAAAVCAGVVVALVPKSAEEKAAGSKPTSLGH